MGAVSVLQNFMFIKNRSPPVIETHYYWAQLNQNNFQKANQGTYPAHHLTFGLTIETAYYNQALGKNYTA